MRVLIVEDDRSIAEPLADDLRRQRNVVDTVDNGLDGFTYARKGVHDVVLLDLVLPGMDGVAVCAALRAAGYTAMIVMLMSREDTEHTVAALDAGADDYLVKPFDYEELAARLRAFERRRAPLRPNILRSGALALDVTQVRVRFGGRAVALTPTEFAILDLLMREPSRVFSRTRLLERALPFASDAASGTMKSHVANLRRKIRAAGCPYDPIETLYGIGYRLAEPT